MSRRLLFPLLGFGAAAAGAGIWCWAQPTIASLPSAHDPITVEQCSLLRKVPSGAPVRPEANPGARVFNAFLTPAEQEEMLRELQPIKRDYGINLIQPVHTAIYRWQMGHLSRPPPVNMLRVTGRPEHAAQRRPWGYGDGMDEAQLPPALRAAVAKVRAIPGLRLGPLRDCTINWRHSGFLRLDPHVDPAGDGENVFVVSVDSPAVVALSPYNWYQLTRWIGNIVFGDERQQVQQDARESWTRHDIDALVPAGAVLHLSADARWKWTHGTRLGVEREGEPLLCDWFGSPDNLIPRGRERHSVVFAFASP